MHLPLSRYFSAGQLPQVLKLVTQVAHSEWQFPQFPASSSCPEGQLAQAEKSVVHVAHAGSQ